MVLIIVSSLYLSNLSNFLHIFFVLNISVSVSLTVTSFYSPFFYISIYSVLSLILWCLMIAHGCPPGSVPFTYEDERQGPYTGHGPNLSCGPTWRFCSHEINEILIKTSVISHSALFSLLGFEKILGNGKLNFNLILMYIFVDI